MKKVDQVLRPEEIEELLKSSFRTTTLLEVFTDLIEGLTIGDICKLMNIPQSSASSLVKSLLETGFLIRDDQNRKYFLTPRLGLMGQSASAQHSDLMEVAKHAVEISLKIDETTVIAMRNGIYSQYIYIHRDSTQDHDDHVSLGSLRPMVCSATGWAMLSSESDYEIAKLIRSTNAKVVDPHWINTAKSALDSVHLSRKNGYAFSKGPSKNGTAGIAVSLSGVRELGSYSLGVAGREEDLVKKEDHIVLALKDFTNR